MARTIQAVRQAVKNLVPVKAGAGVGRETRIMENRRLILKDGSTVDVRHAYSLPPNDQVTAVGPVDPQIGVLRLDRLDGTPVAVVYNFACHPIANTPDRGNSADITGFASRTIEETLGKGAVALFVQGAGGDINPIDYKAVNHIRSAEPLGLMLGLSTLRAVRQIRCQPNADLNVHSEKLELPRADLAPRIREMEAERGRLAESLKGTFLNLDEFLPLMMKYRLSTNSPSLSSYRYLHELKLERPNLSRLDAANRRHLQAYVRNVQTMEQITRLNTNLRLLKNASKNRPRRRQPDGQRGVVRPACGRFCADHISRRTHGGGGVEHQARGQTSACLRGRIHQRLCSLRAHGRAVEKYRRRTGRQRLHARARMAASLRDTCGADGSPTATIGRLLGLHHLVEFLPTLAGSGAFEQRVGAVVVDELLAFPIEIQFLIQRLANNAEHQCLG